MFGFTIISKKLLNGMYAQIQEFDTANKEYGSENTALKVSIESLKTSVQNVLAEKAFLEKENYTKNEKITLLQNELTDQQKSNTDNSILYKQASKNLENQLFDTSSQLDAFKEINSTFSKTLAELKADDVEHLATIEKLSNELAEVIADKEALKKEIEELMRKLTKSEEFITNKVDTKSVPDAKVLVKKPAAKKKAAAKPSL